MKKFLKGLLVTGVSSGVVVLGAFVAHQTGIVDFSGLVETLSMSQDQIVAAVSVAGSSTAGLVAVKVASSIIGAKFSKQDQYIAHLENKVDSLEQKVDPKLDKILAYQEIQADLNIKSRITDESDVARLNAWKEDAGKSFVGTILTEIAKDNQEEIKELADKGLDILKDKLKEIV